MISYIEHSSIDITVLSFAIFGIILLIIYASFVFFVTHKGDFYQKRRWKASVWLGAITGILFQVYLYHSDIKSVWSSLPLSPTDFLNMMFRYLFAPLIIIMPLIFVITLGMHYRLKWDFTSDNLLDKIWKDPNKRNKSPIQLL